MRNYFVTGRMAKIKTTVTSIGENVEKKEDLYSAHEFINNPVILENRLRTLNTVQNVEHKIAIRPNNSIPRNISKRTKNMST